MNKTKTVAVKVAQQGKAVCGVEGYMLKKCADVAAFYLDGWGDTGRIFPVCTSSSVLNGGVVSDFPSITLDDGSDKGELTEIFFPDFEGWDVHAVSGGKTMAVCLTKGQQ